MNAFLIDVITHYTSARPLNSFLTRHAYVGTWPAVYLSVKSIIITSCLVSMERRDKLECGCRIQYCL